MSPLERIARQAVTRWLIKFSLREKLLTSDYILRATENTENFQKKSVMPIGTLRK